MTTYNTGNPVPSTKPQDLFDNAENLDAAVNDRSNDKWVDRLGNERLTWEGMTRLSNLGAAVEAAERAEEAASTAIGANRTVFRATRDELLAAMQGPPVQEDETPGRVTNDPSHTDENPVNGDYVWRDGVLVYSDIQPVSKDGLDQVATSVSQVNESLSAQSVAGQSLRNASQVSTIAPIAVYRPQDDGGQQRDPIAVGVRDNGDLYAQFPVDDERIKANVDARLVTPLGSLHEMELTPSCVPVHTDASGRALLWADYEAKQLYFLGSPVSAGGSSPVFRMTQIMGAILYGQSLANGAGAIGGGPGEILSTSQPFFNRTFGAGPKATKAGSVGYNPGTDTSKPLVEDTLSGDQSGTSNRGETPCSGLANYATLTAAQRYGITPELFRVFASTAGRGGQAIDTLGPNSMWFQVWKDHVTEQQARADDLGLTYSIPALFWIQGETPAVGMDVDGYMAALMEIYDAQVEHIYAFVPAQSARPIMLMYQTGSYGDDRAGIATRAQLQLARLYPDKFRLVTPIYQMPRTTDTLHGTPLTYKWLGAFLGREFAAVATNSPRPADVMPGIPYITSDTEIRVPVKSVFPLQLNGSTQQRGFRVVVDGVDSAVTVSLDGSDVVLTGTGFASAAVVEVRYAFDYLAPGVAIENGATGDLFDSCPDTVFIDGADRSLSTPCPAFIETAIKSTI